VVERHEVGYRGVAWLDAVRLQFLTSEPQQLERRRAVAREEAVERGRPRVAGPAGIAEQQRAPGAGEHQGGAQSGRAAPDNDDVEHLRLNCKETATAGQANSAGEAGKAGAE